MTTVLAEPGDAVLRPHAEHEHQAELAALAVGDDRPRPPGWRLSPWAVTTYLLGGTAPDGTAPVRGGCGPRIRPPGRRSRCR